MTILDILQVLLVMSVAVGLVIWADLYAEHREARKRRREKETPYGR